jgi:hypothetical protein
VEILNGKVNMMHTGVLHHVSFLASFSHNGYDKVACTCCLRCPPMAH